MLKSLFEDELISGMQQEMRKQASAEKPSLVKAAECLHTVLEIFEEQGLTARADQILQLLENINREPAPPVMKTAKIHSLQQLMEAGVTQRDLRELARDNPMAVAKLNVTLRRLGLADHEMARLLGPSRVMSEENAFKTLNPNEPNSILGFESVADTKKKALSDRHTKGLTPEKEVANYKKHGTPFNMTDDSCAIDVHSPVKKSTLSADDFDADFADILNSPTFDIDASDDELMGMEIKEDSLDVFEADTLIEDFEDERD